MLGPRTVLVAAALLLLAVPATAGAAPRRADLKLTRVTVSPAQAAPGARVQISDVVRNGGRARARATRVGYVLSADARKDKADVRLAGTRPIKALARRKQSRGATSVRLPATAKAGPYYLLACADAGRALTESSERNNCAAGRVRVLGRPGAAPDPVVAAAGSAVTGGNTTKPPATGGGTGSPAPGRPFGSFGPFLRTANPLEIDPVADSARAATASMSQFGGTLQATGADGTQYELTLPADALLGQQEITMTPISSIADLPLSQGLMGAVELEPHGLQLAKPATLTIDPPGTDPPVAQQSAFMAQEETGEDFHLHPVGSQQKATINLMHFSTVGVGLGTSADRAAVDARPGSRPLAQLEQALADLTRQDRADDDTDLTPLVAPMMAYYDEVVRPRLQAAETSERLAPAALAQALSWARNAELLGMSGPDYDARQADMMARIKTILLNAIEETYARCVTENSLAAGARLLGWSRQAAIMGIENDGFEKWMKCARYEVEFDSTVTSEGGFTGSTQSQSHNGSLRVVAGELIIDFATIATGAIPSGPLTYQGASWTHTTTYAPSGDCTPVTTTSLIGTTPGTLRASIEFDINLFEPPPGEDDVPRKHVLRLSAQGTGESYRAQNSGCSSTSSDSTDTRWRSIFAGFHGNLPSVTVELDASDQVGEVIGTKTFTGRRTSGGTTQTEETYVELWHRPLR